MAGTLEPTKPVSTLESMKQWPQIIRDYIDDLKLEMRRVTWPTRAQVQATTLVVILTVFAFAAYFKLVDGIIERIIALITSLAK